MSATCVLSGSGTIAEESTILGFPAVALRSSIELPEALDTGAITMTDLDPAAVLRGIRFAMSREDLPERPADYRIKNTSERVVNFMLSTRSSTSSGRGCGRADWFSTAPLRHLYFSPSIGPGPNGNGNGGR